MRPQNVFDIFLLSRDGSAIDARAVLGAIEGSGLMLRLHAEPGRYLYRNDDTGVSFHVAVSPEILAHHPREEISGDDPGEEDDGSVTSEGEEEPERRPDADRDQGEEEEDADEEPFDVVTPPVALTLPLLVPSFFIAEAVEFGRHVGEAADLFLEAPVIEASPGEAPAGERPTNEIISAWTHASRAALLQLGEKARVTEWPSRKASDWWDYGRRRALLESELAPEGISVPPLRAAVHEGEVKSLFIWEVGQPSVFPRADLVLVRREREKMGLLRLRKVVEEGIAPGPKVWDLLAPFSEHRADPVEILIFRNARPAPSQVAAELEVLRLEPLESVRRTELTGVVVVDDDAGAGKEA